MGYDCTFHLIDEQAIQNEFVPKLLGHNRKKTPLDKVRKDAAKLWAIVRKALKEGIDDEGEEMGDGDAASLVCQLACIYSSCALPYHYERGVAFSLFPTEEMEAEFPAKFMFSPEPLFVEVVQHYPRLKGKFPKAFSGNYSTGVYVPAKKVSAVRKWLERQLESLNKRQLRWYRGLLAMLRAAEEKKLAFWEATDLAVPIENQVPGAPELMTADFLGNAPAGASDGASTSEKVKLPIRHSSRVGGWGDLHVLSEPFPDTTILLDLSQWPPRHHVRKREFTWAADRDRDGRWLLVSRTGSGKQLSPNRGHVFTDLRKDPELVLSVEEKGAEVKVEDGFLIGGRVVLVPDTDDYEVGSVVNAWMQYGERMRPAPGLPPYKLRRSVSCTSWIEHIVRGVARLAGGTEVLIWDDVGYEWDGRRFQRTFSLGPIDPHYLLLTTPIPADDDGFFFITAGRLFEVHRGKKAVGHAPMCNDLRAALPGPAGGLLLHEADNPDGDLGKLYFPADGTFIHIELELFGEEDVYDFLCWSQGANRIIASDGYHLYAVPVQSILALPRYDAGTGKKVKA